MALIKYFDWATPPVRSCASILCPVKWHQSTLKFIDTSWLYHIQLCIVSVGTLVWVVEMWLIAFDSLNRFLPPIQQHRYKPGLVSTWHWHTWRICISQMLWLGKRTRGSGGNTIQSTDTANNGSGTTFVTIQEAEEEDVELSPAITISLFHCVSEINSHNADFSSATRFNLLPPVQCRLSF